MDKILFITNKKYVDPTAAEGGVKLCTSEYLSLISTKFDVFVFPLTINSSLSYRIKKKLGITVYNDYPPANFQHELRQSILDNKIDIVFLNMTNTIPFSTLLKSLFPKIKIVLCSHGNESGDFLHEVVMHDKHTGLNKGIAQYALGKMLSKESFYRKYIDLVLTVSEIEENIEKWLGSKKVKMIPRIIPDRGIEINPVRGRIGFFGDLTHYPNAYGLKELLHALSNNNPDNIEFRLVGVGDSEGKAFAKKYPFVTYLGYLEEESLENEVSRWCFSVNPVFYYSRGVSTKLGKALAWGLPVITSQIGMRGYQWENGHILSCETPDQMAKLILQNANDEKAVSYYSEQIRLIKASSPQHRELMTEVINMIN